MFYILLLKPTLANIKIATNIELEVETKDKYKVEYILVDRLYNN